jgi:cell division protein FtsL
MERSGYAKSKGIEKTKSKVKSLDIVIVILVFLAFLTVSIWLTIFLNFGKNIENYKSIIAQSQMELNNRESQISALDSQIDRYIEILNIMEK